MSLRVVGYRNGRRITVDDGPARARPAGWGGSALGHFTGTVVVVPRKPKGTADAVVAKRHRRSA
jgi:hypothetical protein